jgi:hypothetical protein
LLDVEAMEAPVRRRLSPLMAAVAVAVAGLAAAAARLCFERGVRVRLCEQGYGTEIGFGPLRVERTITTWPWFRLGPA